MGHPTSPRFVAPESDGEDVEEPESKRARHRSRSEADAAAEAFGNFSRDEDEDNVVSALLLSGVEETIARVKAKNIVAPAKATFIEM